MLYPAELRAPVNGEQAARGRLGATITLAAEAGKRAPVRRQTARSYLGWPSINLCDIVESPAV